METGVRVRAAPGVELASDVWRPARPGTCPTILVRTPYDRRSLRDVLAVLDPLEVTSRGWALVVQDVRGRHGSSGVFRFLGDDMHDGLETLRWIRSHPWSDGRVVMAGRSYCGRVQELAAATRGAALAAIAPHACGDSRQTWHPGGVLRLDVAAGWIRRLAGPVVRGLPSSGAADLEVVRRLAMPGDPIRRSCEALVPLVLDLDGAHWRALDPPPDRAAGTPSFRSSGWFDSVIGPTIERHTILATLGRDRAAHHLVVGPWTHDDLSGRFRDVSHAGKGGATDIDLRGRESKFLSAAVRGEQLPPQMACVFITGSNRWVTFEGWPPPIRERTWFLQSSPHRNAPGRLTPEPGRHATATLLGAPDDPVPSLGGDALEGCGPCDLTTQAVRPDVRLYESATLERAMEIAGWLVAYVDVESEARCFDLVVTLSDAVQSGPDRWVAAGAVRVRRGGALVAAPLEVAVRVGPCHHVFRAGHTVRVRLQTSDFPRLYPNPQTGRTLLEGPPFTARRVTHVVHHGGPGPSRMCLPAVVAQSA